MAWVVGLVVVASLAGCGDTCVDCLCHCSGDGRAGGGETIRLQYYTGFDCGQRCENGPGGCGVGKVRSVECLETKIVDGRPAPVRCAQAAPMLPAASAPRAAVGSARR
jgi:hypothetical protein